MAKRRANGEGSIYKRKDGRWEGRYTVGYREDGKQIFKNVLAKTQAECKEKLKAAIAAAKEFPTKAPPPTAYTVAQWVDEINIFSCKMKGAQRGGFRIETFGGIKDNLAFDLTNIIVSFLIIFICLVNFFFKTSMLYACGLDMRLLLLLAFHGICGGEHRSKRLKFVCPGAHRVGTTMINRCESPCTKSAFGRCVYVYPDKDLRLYPGVSRDDPAFVVIYKQRTAVERSISSIKQTLCLEGRKTSNVLTTKADLFLAGIVQLLCVLLAGKLHKPALARRPRLLLAA